MPLDIKSKLLFLTTPVNGVTGSFVITGVNDAKTGVAFEPSLFIIQRCTDGFVDTGASQFVGQSYGFDDGTIAMGQCRQSQWQFSALFMSGGFDNSNSILATVDLFTPRFTTKGKITAKSSGQFTYTLTINEFGLVRYSVLCLGGADLLHAIGVTSLVSATTAITGLGFRPTGLITVNTGNLGAEDNPNNVAGIGFVGTDLAQVSAVALPQLLSNPVDAFRYQRTDKAGIGLDPASEVSLFSLVCNSLDADGFTIARTGTIIGLIYLALGGVDIKVGSLLQPVADGTASVDILGVRPNAVLLASVGGPVSGVLQTDASLSTGMSDGSISASAWYSYLDGSTIAGNAGQMWGGSKGIFFATPNGQNSSDAILTGQASISTNPNGFRLPFTNCDGLQREILYLTFGTPIDVEELSGIYKLVPGKRNDTLYLTYSPVTTEDRKIP